MYLLVPLPRSRKSRGLSLPLPWGQNEMEKMKKRRKNTVVNISNIIRWHQCKLLPSKQYYFSLPSSNLLTYLFCCLLTSFVLSSQIDQRSLKHCYPRNSHGWASLVSIPNTQPVTQSSTDTGPCTWTCHSVPSLTFHSLHSWPTWTQPNIDTSMLPFLPLLYISVCFLTLLLAFNSLWK